ncbi:MAG: hypothetical protein Q8O40_02585 [Chloroflexota bacterium]|nr:hypothetical protein [Chloroflexota bacterium]
MMWGSWNCGSVGGCSPCPKPYADMYRQVYYFYGSWSESEQSCYCTAYCGSVIEGICNGCASPC